MLINEVDADSPSTDTAEFVELYGPPSTPLDGLCILFFNGSTDKSYLTQDLDGYSLDANGFFVFGNPGVIPAPALTFANNTLQNGPDAVALYEAAACLTTFPNNSLVTTTNLVDAIVYGNGDPDDVGLLPLLNAGQAQVDEGGGGNAGSQSNARCADGSGGARNTATYRQVTVSPGTANNCAAATATPAPVATQTPVVTPGVADLQISKSSSVSAVSAGQLFTYTIVINNVGPGAAQSVAVRDLLPAGLSLTSAAIHVQKGTGAKVVTGSTELTGTVTTLNAGGVVTITARTLVALNAAGPTLTNSADVTAANDSTPANNTASVTVNLAPAAGSAVLINEVDADTPGSDTAEFVELYGPPNTSLNGLCLVLLNGTNDSSYLAEDLDGYSLDANGYFVIGNAGVSNVGLTIANSTIQNGPDAAALYVASACTAVFPSGTALTTVNLVDAIVYDFGKTVDAGLSPLLNAGQAQVDEDTNNAGATQASARCPDGSGGARVTTAYRQVAPSPGGANCTTGTATPTATATLQPIVTPTPQAKATPVPTATATPVIALSNQKLYLPLVTR
ncbi:MAG: hypothetical protein NT075_32590 [Chloroflexi bacterium]|nr:hypothetical protein [Chloroflexota bacterium]